jgi:hypothetical protein
MKGPETMARMKYIYAIAILAGFIIAGLLIKLILGLLF